MTSSVINYIITCPKNVTNCKGHNFITTGTTEKQKRKLIKEMFCFSVVPVVIHVPCIPILNTVATTVKMFVFNLT